MSNGSALFSSTESFLQYLLGHVFQNDSFNSSCRLDSLRPKKNGTATGVDAICAYYHDPAHAGMDIKELYTELRNLTQGITQLGNYSLDTDSLYVNGYNKPGPEEPCTTHETATTTLPSPSASLQPEPATAIGHHLKTLTINFTITNLPYSSNMSNGSALFSSTESFLQYLLGHMFQNGPLNSSCRLDSLRPKKNGTATGVDAICAYYHDPAHPGMDIKELYTELRNLTQGITQLGNYSLDKDSLYVNGYNKPGPEQPSTTHETATTTLPSPIASLQPEPATAIGHHLKTLTINFTITNLPYSSNMSNGSALFSSTESFLQHLLGHVFQNDSFNSSCRLDSLRPKKNGTATGVDAICAYYHDPAHPGMDIKELYTELRNLTQGITQLGNYSLDTDSLYVNGYNKPGPEEPSTTREPAITTLPSPSASLQPEPATGHHLKTLTINFTITNLPYSSNMSNGSALFSSTESFLQYLLGHVFQNNSFNSSCRLDSLRPKKNGTATGVDAICAYYHDPAHAGMDIKELYTELRNLTQGITHLGNYSLDKDSLYVNCYNEHDAEGLPTTPESLTTILASPSSSAQPETITEMKPPTLLPTEIPTTSSSSQHFNLNFTITNLPYSQDIAQPGTTKHQQNKRSIEYALNQLFRNSSIKSYFSDCQVLAFRSVSNSNHTGVDSVCNFSPLARRVDRVAIYEEFLRMTQNGTQLLNFTLDRKSVLVDGYSSNRDDDVIKNSGLPFWAIILICLAVLLVFITCLMCCFLLTVCRRKKEGDYQVQRHRLGYYLPHLDLRKLP
ncbi:MUC16 [Lemmus lemmus]